MRLEELLEKAKRLEVRSRHLARSRYAGLYRGAFKGQGIEFAEVREYAPGDDVRLIDWNVSARSQSLYIKKTVEERDRSVLVVLDGSETLAFGTSRRTKLDLLLEIGSILILAGFFAGDRVSLALLAGRLESYVPPAKGWNHAARLIREMVSRAPSAAPPPLDPLWSFLNSPGIPRSLVFFLTDYQAAFERQNSLRAAARKHEIVALLASDPREWTLPNVGRIRVRRPGTSEVTVVRTSSAEVRAEFERRALARKHSVEGTLAAVGAEYQELSTAEDPDVALRRFLSARAVRGR